MIETITLRVHATVYDDIDLLMGLNAAMDIPGVERDGVAINYDDQAVESVEVSAQFRSPELKELVTALMQDCIQKHAVRYAS